MEAYQLLLISSVAEICRFEINTRSQVTNFGVSVAIATLCLTLLLMSLFSSQTKSEKPTVLRELYKGLTVSKTSSLYPFLALFKRSLVVVLLVAINFVTIKTKLLAMGVAQGCHILYILMFRPYKQVRDTIIDVINETSLLVALYMMRKSQTEDSWDENTENLVIGSSVGSLAVVLLVVLADLTFSLFR